MKAYSRTVLKVGIGASLTVYTDWGSINFYGAKDISRTLQVVASIDMLSEKISIIGEKFP